MTNRNDGVSSLVYVAPERSKENEEHCFCISWRCGGCVDDTCLCSVQGPRPAQWMAERSSLRRFGPCRPSICSRLQRESFEDRSLEWHSGYSSRSGLRLMWAERHEGEAPTGGLFFLLALLFGCRASDACMDALGADLAPAETANL